MDKLSAQFISVAIIAGLIFLTYRELHPNAATAVAAPDLVSVNGPYPGDRAVRVFVNWDEHKHTGDYLPADALFWVILFTEEPCTLNVANAENMRRAWRQRHLGCWYPLQGGYWAWVTDDETTVGSGAWETFPRALLHTDGSAAITEPNYDSGTFIYQWQQNQVAHMNDHDNEKP